MNQLNERRNLLRSSFFDCPTRIPPDVDLVFRLTVLRVNLTLSSLLFYTNALIIIVIRFYKLRFFRLENHMQPIRSQIVKLFTGFIAGAILISSPSYSVIAIALSDQRYAPSETGLAPHPYDIGSPTLTEIWVSPGVSGNDSNDGLTPGTPLKTLTAAWSKIPPGILTSTGYRINLQPGTYPCEPAEPDNCLNNFGNRTGTYAFPIIIRASGGQGTVTISGGLDILDVSYLYLIDLTLRGGTPLPTNSSGNNLLHLASVDHVLLR